MPHIYQSFLSCIVHNQPIQNPSRRETISCHTKEDDPLEECILIFTAYGQQFIAYLQPVPDQCLHMSEIYDAGTMDPDEIAFGQLAPDRCEVKEITRLRPPVRWMRE